MSHEICIKDSSHHARGNQARHSNHPCRHHQQYVLESLSVAFDCQDSRIWNHKMFYQAVLLCSQMMRCLPSLDVFVLENNVYGFWEAGEVDLFYEERC